MSIGPPLRETFGIELEFVIRFKPPEGVDFEDDWKWSVTSPMPQEAMVNNLHEAGFAVNQYSTEWNPEWSPGKWTVSDDGSVDPYEQEEECDEEDDVHEHDSKYKHTCLSVELKSPVLSKCEESLDEIRRVVELINSKFDTVVNGSTGFHVHVGNEHRGYPLTTLRRFATLAAVFEERIEALHPSSRINNKWCIPISSVLKSTNVFEKSVEIAENSKTQDQLIRRMNGYTKETTYNFQNLAPARFQTIEFRQHEGTMDADRILAWVRFTTRLKLPHTFLHVSVLLRILIASPLGTKAVPMSLEADETLLSSPDPLANSPDTVAFSSPSKTAQNRLLANRTPKGIDSTPKNQTVQLQNFVISTPSNKVNTLDLSPTRSKAKTENALSPWRIRVTVEAERDEESNRTGTNAAKLLDFRSPTKKSSGQSTVTTIPVKGLESSPPVPKRRGRPRKSGTTPVKRNGTPKPSRRSKRLSMDQPLEEHVRNEGSHGTADNKPTPAARKGRFSERNTSASKADPQANKAQASVPSVKQLRTGDVSSVRGAPGRRGRGKGNTGSPVKIAVDPQTGSDRVVSSEDPGITGETGQILRDIDINSAASSSGASNQPAPENDDMGLILGKGTSKSVSKEIKDKVTASENPRSPTAGAETMISRSNVTRPQATDGRADDADLWQDLTRNNGFDSDTGSDNEQGKDEDTNLSGLDSVLESEGFSMVSIASIPSAREHLSSPSSRLWAEGEPPLIKRGGPSSYQGPLMANRSGNSNSADENDVRIRSTLDRRNAAAFEEAISEYPNSSMLIALTKSPCAPAKNRSRAQHNMSENRFVSSGQKGKASVAGTEIQSSPPARVVPHNTQLAQQTPSLVYSSPTLPPPLVPTSTKKTRTPKLARVIRTGIALQGILGNEALLRIPYSSPAKGPIAKQKSPKERLDDLFSGFGDGTRRELRAGLRLGEELAKRQAGSNRPIDQRAPVEPNGLDDVFTEESTAYPRLPTPEDSKEYSLPLPGNEHREVEYPALLSPDQSSSPAKISREKNYDAMSWRVDTPVKVLRTEATSPPSIEHDVGNETNWSTMEGREAKWQRERKAVSRQIENANKSQVIVIDDTAVLSDDEDVIGSSSQDELAEQQSETQQDSGRAEAQSSSLASSPGLPETQDPYPTIDMFKPPRGKIPSPWRRNSNMVYSDEAVEDEAALFWQPDTCSKKASREREERRRRKDEKKLDVLSFPALKPSSTINNERQAELEDLDLLENGDKVEPEEFATNSSDLEGSAYDDSDHGKAQDEGDDEAKEVYDELKSKAGAVEDISELYSDEDPEEGYTGERLAPQPDVVNDGDSKFGQAETTSAFIDTSSRQVVRQLNRELEEAVVEEVLQPTPQVNNAASQAGFRSRFFSGLSAFTPSFLQSQSKPALSKASQELSSSMTVQQTLHTLTSERLTTLISHHSAELSIREPWTKTNYKVIQELYKLARAAPSAPSNYTSQRYYGKQVAGNGHQIVLQSKELWVIEVFTNLLREKSPAGRAGGKIEFDEWYLARRVFSLVYGEECRREEEETKRRKEMRV
ncbi:MAG: hypothetical protein M1812_006245 [Candelaria pacifica]|nr:MAG: hypothetical protein M1812_006245 [Candelaria pacifica]